jgi:hypothetical protein
MEQQKPQPIEIEPLVTQGELDVDRVEAETRPSRQVALAEVFDGEPELASGQVVTWAGLVGADGELVAPFNQQWRQAAHQIYIESIPLAGLRQQDEAWQRWFFDEYSSRLERQKLAEIRQLKVKARQEYLATPTAHNFVWLRQSAIKEVLGSDELAQWYEETSREAMPKSITGRMPEELMEFHQAIVEQLGISPIEVIRKTNAIISGYRSQQMERANRHLPTESWPETSETLHRVLVGVLHGPELVEQYEAIMHEYGISYHTSARAVNLFSYNEEAHERLGVWPIQIEQAVEEKQRQALAERLVEAGKMTRAEIELVWEKPLDKLGQQWYELMDKYEQEVEKLKNKGGKNLDEIIQLRRARANKNALLTRRSLAHHYYYLAVVEYNQANGLPLAMGELNNYKTDKEEAYHNYAEEKFETPNQYADRAALIASRRAIINRLLADLADPLSKELRQVKKDMRIAKDKIAQRQRSLATNGESIKKFKTRIERLEQDLDDETLADNNDLKFAGSYRSGLRNYLQQTYREKVEKLQADVVKVQSQLKHEAFPVVVADMRSFASRKAVDQVWQGLSPADRQKAITSVICEKIAGYEKKIDDKKVDRAVAEEDLTRQTNRLAHAKAMLPLIQQESANYENSAAKALLDQFQQVAPEYMKQLVVYEHERQAWEADFKNELAAIDAKYDNLAEQMRERIRRRAKQMTFGVKRELFEQITDQPVTEQNYRQVADLWLVSSGVVVADKDKAKPPLGLAVDVAGLSDKLSVMADDQLAQQLWRKYWAQTAEVKPTRLAEQLNRTVDHTPKNPDEQMMSHALADLGLAYQPKPLIRTENGKLTLTELRPEDLAFARPILKALGGFVGALSKSPQMVDWNKQRQALAGKISYARATDVPVSAVQIDGDKQITLNLYSPQPDQAEAAFDVAINQLGMNLYGQLGREQRSQFVDIFDVPRGIGQADYFQLTKGVLLSDARQRNTAVQRISFIYQFRQYIAGELVGEQKEFFDEIKANYSPTQ